MSQLRGMALVFYLQTLHYKRDTPFILPSIEVGLPV